MQSGNHSQLRTLPDSHCHIRVPADKDAEKSLFRDLLASETSRLICATSPTTDWDALALLAAAASASGRSNVVRVGFGVHPWWVGSDHLFFCPGQNGANSVNPPWCAKLVSLLEQFPSAIVGECGLDKNLNKSLLSAASSNNKDNGNDRDGSTSIDLAQQQQRVFEAQLDIAARMRRPVSVHCVNRFGAMLEILSQRPIQMYPPVIIFHGFTGSADFVKSVLKLSAGRGSRFYFGLGAATSATLKAFPDLVAMLPKDRILLESDAFVNDPTERPVEKLNAMAALLAQHAGVDVETLAQNQEVALRT